MKKVYLLLVFTFAIQLDGQNIYTYAGIGTPGFSGDGGSALSAEFDGPGNLVFDGSGNIYLSDYQNNRIRKITPGGIINTIAGTGGTGSFGDGGQATLATIQNPWGIAIDGSGNIYIAQPSNNKVRKINTSGIITTIAGTGTPGFAGDGGLATSAWLNNPLGIALDGIGNIYIAEGAHRVRMINASGIISTVAGTVTSGFSGDGGLAISAELNSPADVRVDATGNIYIADSGNGRLRKVNSSGIISTMAGTGGSGSTGDSGPAASAQIGRPGSITFDASGNLYLSDTWNGVIRKINALGIISTVAGNGTTGYSGDGGPAILAQTNGPGGIAFDASNNIYIADTDNNRVRMICVSSCPLGIEENSLSGGLKIFPNPASSVLTISSEQNTFENSEIEIANYLGQSVLKLPFTKTVDVANLAQGMYTVKISSAKGQTLTKKFVKD